MKRRNRERFSDVCRWWPVTLACASVLLAAATQAQDREPGVGDNPEAPVADVYWLAGDRYAIVAIPEDGPPLQVTVEKSDSGWKLRPEEVYSDPSWHELWRRVFMVDEGAELWLRALDELNNLAESRVLRFRVPDRRMVIRKLAEGEVMVGFVAIERFHFVKRSVDGDDKKWDKREPVNIDLPALLALADEKGKTLEQIFQPTVPPDYDGWIRSVLDQPEGGRLVVYPDKKGRWLRLIESSVSEESWQGLGFAAKQPVSEVPQKELENKDDEKKKEEEEKKEEDKKEETAADMQADDSPLNKLHLVVGIGLRTLALAAILLVFMSRSAPAPSIGPGYGRTASALVGALHEDAIKSRSNISEGDARLATLVLDYAREIYQEIAESLPSLSSRELEKKLEHKVAAGVEERLLKNLGLEGLEIKEARTRVRSGSEIDRKYKSAVEAGSSEAESVGQFLKDTFQELEKARKEIGELSKDVKNLNSERERLKDQESSLRSEIGGLIERERRANDRVQRVLKEKSQCEERLSSLGAEREDLKKWNRGLREDLIDVQSSLRRFEELEKLKRDKFRRIEEATTSTREWQIAYWDKTNHAPSTAVLQSLYYLGQSQVLRGILTNDEVFESVGWVNLRNVMRTIGGVAGLEHWSERLRAARADIEKMGIPVKMDFKSEDRERAVMAKLLRHMTSPGETLMPFDVQQLTSGWPFYFRIESRKVLGVSRSGG